MKRIILVLSYSLVSFTAAACLFTAMILVANSAYADPAGNGSVNQTRSATANASVRVNNIAGSIAVQGWSNNQVQVRSEEHTSELQSPKDLVCRLLLEKKKKT